MSVTDKIKSPWFWKAFLVSLVTYSGLAFFGIIF